MRLRPRMVALLIPRDDRRAHAQERSARNTLRPRTGLVAVSPMSPPIRTNFGRVLPPIGCPPKPEAPARDIAAQRGV